MASGLFTGMKNVLLEVEVPKKKYGEFSSQYHTVTRRFPKKALVQIQDNKWGIECRVYFDADPATVKNMETTGYHVEVRSTGYGSDRDFRVNSEKLFWEMVANGFDLGPN